MPVDASIYGQIRQPEGPLDQYGKALQLKALMGQGRLQELQTTKTERDLAEEQALHDVFSKAPTGATLESLVPEALRASPKVGIELQGKVLTQKKLQGDIDKTQMELTSKAAELHRDQLANVNDPQAAAQWVQAGYSDPHIAPILSRGGTVEQAVARIPQDPAQFQEWKAKNGMGIQKFLEMQNTNAQHALNRAQTGAAQTESARHNAVTELHSALTAKETARHHAALEGDPQIIEDTAQAIAKGNLAPLSGFALARPMAQNIMARVVQINPDFDPTQFQTRQKAEKDFATGKQGNTVRSFNVALYHLDTLGQLADALNNGNMQAVNKIGNFVSTQTGHPAPSNFEAAKKIVGDEIVKAIVGSGGGVGDREQAAKTVDAANSPAKLQGVINTYKDLMHGQIRGLREQYSATTGKADFEQKYLSPEVRDMVKKKDGGTAIRAQADAIISGGR